MKNTELQTTNITEIPEKKGGKLKKGDIAMITKKEYSGWISLIGKVLFIDDEKIKIAVIKEDYNDNHSIEIFTSKIDNEDIKLSFGDKSDLMTTIFDLRQKSRKKYEFRKNELNTIKKSIVNFEKDLSCLMVDGDLSENILLNKSSSLNEEIPLENIPF